MNTKQERADFKRYYGTLFDLSETTDTWGNPRFVHESVEAIWYGWKDRAALQSQDQVDAERYRYLSSMATQQADSLGPIFRIDVRRTPQTMYNFDAAIDHARRIEGDSNADS